MPEIQWRGAVAEVETMALLLLPPAAAAAAEPIKTTVSSALRHPEPLLPSSKCIVSIKRSHLSLFPFLRLSSNARSSISSSAAAAAVVSSSSISLPSADSPLCTKWMVVMEKPPIPASSRKEIIDYYVQTLARVLGSEEEAQMCIYDASWQTHFGFCCDIDEHLSRELSSLPGVVSVRPDNDAESMRKDYSNSNPLIGAQARTDRLFSKFFPSAVNSDYWIVRMEKPGVEVVSKAQMVDYYAQILSKIMGNEKDAQVSIYHISWEEDFGFCCRIDDDCARELAGVPGVLSVQPDMNSESKNKDYKGYGTLEKLKDSSDSSETIGTPEVKTKRLFVTGLSFYTSEKTLRAAFEGFGELIEVKIIMDKISKRSKGYAFIEYTTEAAAGSALKEMNGKIINGWMIVVDVAKTNPPKYNRGLPRPSSTSSPPSY